MTTRSAQVSRATVRFGQAAYVAGSAAVSFTLVAVYDDVDWVELTAAYFDHPDMRELFETLAGDDEDAAITAWEELLPSVMESGDVFESTAAAIPLLLKIAVTAQFQRAEILETAGMCADPDVAAGDRLPLVRAALAAHVHEVVPLLADPDPQVREAAAYVLAQSAGQ